MNQISIILHAFLGIAKMIKGSGGKDTLFYTTDDKQKGHMGTPVKNISITLFINTSFNLKENE